MAEEARNAIGIIQTDIETIEECIRLAAGYGGRRITKRVTEPICQCLIDGGFTVTLQYMLDDGTGIYLIGW